MARAKNKTASDTGRGRKRRWFLIAAAGLVAALMTLAVLLVLVSFIVPGLWTEYTDGGDIHLREGDPAIRSMVWGPVRLFGGQVNDTPHNVGGGLSDSGRTLIFARRLPKKKDADLFITRFNGERWSAPRPLKALNTDADELAPILSRDGKRIYFHSNRPGGLGGYDIYSSHRDGRRWPMPCNLGKKINSEFDECDPALPASEDDLYFASNRPKTIGLPPAERKAAWKAIMADAEGDYDIYAAENVIVPARANPLRDTTFRKVFITELGGSPKTEKAVAAALGWLTKSQDADGRWSSGRHGGQAKHDNAATGFAILGYLGWGANHTEEGPYQEPLAKAVKWLAGRAGKDGDLTAGLSNGMYDQGIATMALAEAYELTKDPALLGPLERAAAFIVRAQNKSLGGWRYKPGSADCDTSVVGWQVMALWSARNAGINVPESSFKLAAKWMDRVGSGKHRGLYGYTGPGKSAAMTAEGMFVRQLLGAAPAEPRQNESAAYAAKLAPKPNSNAPNLYFIYYGSLALYQHQGPHWEKWNSQIKPLLLRRQIKKGANAGTWKGGRYAGSSGRVIATAMAALSLEVYYRYLPMYDVEGRGTAAVKKTIKKAIIKVVKTPRPPPSFVPLTARRIDELCTPANDRCPELTQHDDFVYFSSDRAGGIGRLDIYRARLDHGEIGPAENLGPYINSPADDTDPSLASHGFELTFASGRELGEFNPTLLYHTIAREIEPVHDAYILFAILSFLDQIKWWLLGLAASVAALIALIAWYLRVADDPQMSRLAKCMLGSVGAHALLLILLSVWMISLTIEENAGDPMQISVDANSLANEKLALALREQVNTVDSTPEMAMIRSDIKPTAIPNLKPEITSPRNMAESKFKVDPAELEANAKELKAREPATRAKPPEERRTRIKFRPPKINLERRPPKRPDSGAKSKDVEVAVRRVRSSSDASSFATPSSSAFAISGRRPPSCERSRRPTPRPRPPSSR